MSDYESDNSNASDSEDERPPILSIRKKNVSIGDTAASVAKKSGAAAAASAAIKSATGAAADSDDDFAGVTDDSDIETEDDSDEDDEDGFHSATAAAASIRSKTAASKRAMAADPDADPEDSDYDDDEAAAAGEQGLDDDEYGAAAAEEFGAAAASSRSRARFESLFQESDDEDDESGSATAAAEKNYLMKFDQQMRNNIITDYHPELIQHNYEEIQTLSTVVRDEDGIICDPLHTTLPFITKYEKTRIIGERARQINSGSKPMITVPEGMIDGYLIAMLEYDQKKIPFILKRPLPSGGVEYWKFSDLEAI
jgi:DNA-directed RNA polymerase subunit K/omega